MKVIVYAHNPQNTRNLVNHLIINGFSVTSVSSLQELIMSVKEDFDGETLFICGSRHYDGDMMNPYEAIGWYKVNLPFVFVTKCDGKHQELKENQAFNEKWKIKNREFLESCSEEMQSDVRKVFSCIEGHLNSREKSGGISIDDFYDDENTTATIVPQVQESIHVPNREGRELLALKSLPKSRCRLLELFMEKPNVDVTVEEILQEMWPVEMKSPSSVALASLKSRLYAYVHDIRNALECSDGVFKLLHTSKETYMLSVGVSPKSHSRIYTIHNGDRPSSVTSI